MGSAGLASMASDTASVMAFPTALAGDWRSDLVAMPPIALAMASPMLRGSVIVSRRRAAALD